MKQKLKLIINVSAFLALAFTATAQGVNSPKPDAPGGLYERMFQERIQLLKETANASDVMGMTVANPQGEKLGKVHEIFVNLKSGRIVEVVLAARSGGLTAVPPQVLHNSDDRKSLVLDVTPERFMAAPRFHTAAADATTESNLVSAVYVYYGEEAYFVSDPEGLWTTYPNGTPNRDGTRSTDEGRNAAIDHHVADDSNTIATRDPDGKETGNYYSNQHRSLNSWSSLGNVRKVSHLTGVTIRNLQDVKLGKVHDFVVDFTAGRLAAVVISSGEVFGLGGQLSCAPPSSFQFDPIRKDLQLDATPEMLASDSRYAEGEWANFSLAAYTNGTYYPYKVTPYDDVSAPAANQADGNAVRRLDNKQLAAVTQGTSQSDEDIQSKIHNAILADNTLSTNAKSILVVTADGRVTLRGPVNNGDEKQQLGVIAERIAMAGNVDNELQVQITAQN